MDLHPGPINKDIADESQFLVMYDENDDYRNSKLKPELLEK